MTPSPFANRLSNNFRHWRKWAKRQGLTAFRVYDRDMPEHPYAVDWYAGHAHVAEYPRRSALRDAGLEQARRQAVSDVAEALEVEPSHVHFKTHLPRGQAEYRRKGNEGERLVVEEQGLRFWVNLSDYLDTGLFLDHRLTRARVRQEAQDKRMLNLFSYTGSFTVYAAAGGARSTLSVDLSNTYLTWGQDNLVLNGLEGTRHQRLCTDVLDWVGSARSSSDRYDLIVLDPPSFSVSKRMSKGFEVQRDHGKLLDDVRALLAPGGALYFSTNLQGFEPGSALRSSAEELTPRSLPEDFRRHVPHRCWKVAAG